MSKSLHFFNSLTRKLEPFTPLDGNRVRFYTCGPTVYNFAHIGNFRAYVFEDVLRRTLKFFGYDVTQVMNLTDVDDKTIRGAIQNKVSLDAFTKPFKDAFFADLKTLRIESAEHYPAATDHIPEMLDLIAALMAKGLAYKSDDGSVYFKISAFPNYGKLAHLDPSTLRSGVRINNDEYEKEGVADFALWKAWDAADGDVVWDSPYGRGRPGWHLECSAMARKYLGDSFDLHTGGIDNLFPHHENEIAQSEGATGKPFVNVWMHCAHLRVNGEKMSKSLGNFYTLRDLLEKGYTGREIRYVLLQAQYRQPLNFTFESLDNARKALNRIDDFVERIIYQLMDDNEKAKEQNNNINSEFAPFVTTYLKKFTEAMADDLNLPEAFAALFNFIREGNIALDKNEPTNGAWEVIDKTNRVLAIMDAFDLRLDNVDEVYAEHVKSEISEQVIQYAKAHADAIPIEVQLILSARQTARVEKHWAESDRLRDELHKLGWEVRDSKDGQTLKKVAR